MAKKNSRWKKPNKRYPESTNLGKYQEEPNWSKGAKTSKKG